MKTICILTFGASEVQVNITKKLPEGCTIETQNNKAKLIIKSESTETSINLKQNRYFHDWFLLDQPRSDGKTVLDNIGILGSVIDMPLTIPLIDSFQKGNQKISKFILVYTDQRDTGKDSENGKNDDFRKSDSLYYASIFKEFLIDRFHYTKDAFIDYPVHENVTDYDYLFTRFGEDCKKIIPYKPEEIEKIYLLPQGGIDQINTSLTLQLIKCFGNKVEIYQVKEKDNPKKIRFAEIYLRDLTFDHILTLAEKGDYSGALHILNTLGSERYKSLSALLKFGDLKINARFEEIKNIGRKAFDNDTVPRIVLEAKSGIPRCRDEVIKLFTEPQSKKNDYAYRVSEYFEIARFFNKPELCNRFVMAFAIFIESFLNHYNTLKTGFDLVDKYDKSSREMVQQIKSDEEVGRILEGKFEVKESIQFLTTPVLMSVALKYSQQNELIERLCKTNGSFKNHSCNLDFLRNNLAHRGKGIKQVNFNKISKLFKEISELFTDKPSSFEELNKEIRTTIDNYRHQLL